MRTLLCARRTGKAGAGRSGCTPATGKTSAEADSFGGNSREQVSADQPLPPIQVLASFILADPIRPNAAETLAYFQQEGVDLKLISGDNPVTVSALAAQAGSRRRIGILI